MTRCAILLLCAVPVLAAPVPKAVKKPTLDGTWEVTERNSEGKPYAVSGEFWVFQSTEILVVNVKDPADIQGAKGHAMKLARPDENDPSQLDVIQSSSGGKPYSTFGRVEVDADSLRIAFDSTGKLKSPEKCEPGAGVSFIVFKRVDPAKLKAK